MAGKTLRTESSPKTEKKREILREKERGRKRERILESEVDKTYQCSQ